MPGGGRGGGGGTIYVVEVCFHGRLGVATPSVTLGVWQAVIRGHASHYRLQSAPPLAGGLYQTRIRLAYTSQIISPHPTEASFSVRGICPPFI